MMDRLDTGLESADVLRERLARLRELWGGVIASDDGILLPHSETAGVAPAKTLPDDLTRFRQQVAELMQLIHPEDSLTGPPPSPASVGDNAPKLPSATAER